MNYTFCTTAIPPSPLRPYDPFADVRRMGDVFATIRRKQPACRLSEIEQQMLVEERKRFANFRYNQLAPLIIEQAHGEYGYNVIEALNLTYEAALYRHGYNGIAFDWNYRKAVFFVDSTYTVGKKKESAESFWLSLVDGITASLIWLTEDYHASDVIFAVDVAGGAVWREDGRNGLDSLAVCNFTITQTFFVIQAAHRTVRKQSQSLEKA